MCGPYKSSSQVYLVHPLLFVCVVTQETHMSWGNPPGALGDPGSSADLIVSDLNFSKLNCHSSRSQGAGRGPGVLTRAVSMSSTRNLAHQMLEPRLVEIAQRGRREMEP